MNVIQKQIAKLKKRLPVIVVEEADTYIELKTLVFGPDDQNSPFHQQLFECTLQLTNQYPAKPPSMCLSKNAIYHPNIDCSSGSVCVNLKNDGWDSNYDLAQFIITVIPTLLLNPNTDDPHNMEAAKLYRNDRNKWFQKATTCVRSGALTPQKLSNQNFKYPNEFLQQCAQCNFNILGVNKNETNDKCVVYKSQQHIIDEKQQMLLNNAYLKQQRLQEEKDYKFALQLQTEDWK